MKSRHVVNTKSANIFHRFNYLFVNDSIIHFVSNRTTRKVAVTPTSPVYFYHEIPEGVESVVVKAESSSGSCAVLSVQEAVVCCCVIVLLVCCVVVLLVCCCVFAFGQRFHRFHVRFEL